MAMQINESYKHPGTYYAEQVKEKQAVERADKEKEEETKNSGKLSEPHDQRKSLSVCTGWGGMRTVAGKSFLMIRRLPVRMESSSRRWAAVRESQMRCVSLIRTE